MKHTKKSVKRRTYFFSDLNKDLDQKKSTNNEESVMRR